MMHNHPDSIFVGPFLLGLALILVAGIAFALYDVNQWRTALLGRPVPASAWRRSLVPVVASALLWMSFCLLAATTIDIWRAVMLPTSAALCNFSVIALFIFRAVQVGINQRFPLPFRYPKGGAFDDPHGNAVLAEAAEFGMP